MKSFPKIAIGIILFLVVIQFYPIDRSVKKAPKAYGILRMENAPGKIVNLVKTACYDCHSNETQYPDYSFYAPISWYIEYHVEEGRKNANFSNWKRYDKDQKNSIIDNSIQAIENHIMPLTSYVTKHPKANLTEENRILLTDWFKSIRK